jgi:NADPH:quinone reductase
MRAVVFTQTGAPEVIEIRDLPEPRPGPGQVLVRVRGAGLNRADLLQRRGHYPPPPGVRADVPGLELAGEVAAVGDGVAWRVGDRVMALVGGEAQAELAVVHERLLLPVPDPMDLVAAGGLPEALVTAHDALVTQGGLRAGWTVLIHAVGSGVATIALQIVKAAGGIAIGTARSDDKLARAAALGMDAGVRVDGAAPRFADEVRALTGGRGVQIVLDLVGGAYLAESVAALATGGRVLAVGTLAGAVTSIDLGALMRRRAALIGTVLRSRPLEDRARAVQDCALLLASGKVRPVVDEIMPLERAKEAHERMEANRTFGKIVLRP